MKKILLATSVCSAMLMMYSCKPSPEEMKKKFVKECVSAIPSNTIPTDAAKEYCDCSAEILLKKYSTEELAEMNKKTMADPAVKAKMMEDVRPCLETLAQRTQPQQQ